MRTARDYHDGCLDGVGATYGHRHPFETCPHEECRKARQPLSEGIAVPATRLDHEVEPTGTRLPMADAEPLTSRARSSEGEQPSMEDPRRVSALLHALRGCVPCLEETIAMARDLNVPHAAVRLQLAIVRQVIDATSKEGIAVPAGEKAEELQKIRALCVEAGMREESTTLDYIRSVFYMLRKYLKAASGGSDVPPRVEGNDPDEQLHTGDDDRLDLVSSILATAEELEGNEEMMECAASIIDDCHKLDELIIATIKRERAAADRTSETP